MPDESPATLATVAASAGVSVATVSKVLNGRADVGPETRARVQSLLQEHDYVERRSDTTRRTQVQQPTVELVFHGRQSSYSVEVLQGVLQAATEAEVAVAVSVRPRHQRSAGVEGTASWVRRLVTAGRQAVIDVVDDVNQGDLTGLSRARLPLVVIDPINLPRRQVTSVGATNFSGGLAATQHLLDLGHRRIGYMGAEPSSTYNQARLHGYRAALEAAGIPAMEGYARAGGSHYEDGVAGGAELLDLPERPTAVFAATDELAAGVIEAARVRGLRVPQDLSVVGFDDTELASLLSPPLTTVRQPLREMGAVALRTALRLAAGEALESHRVELATELVVRSSTASLQPAQ
ncbi:MAG: LacI family transcriptional regulator [Friedmanniella sp.]|nr:LacI family transcriptional regulator [Friedmanniella sp.]